jgi:hypothetical protein
MIYEKPELLVGDGSQDNPAALEGLNLFCAICCISD